MINGCSVSTSEPPWRTLVLGWCRTRLSSRMGSILVEARFTETTDGISNSSLTATQIGSYPTLKTLQWRHNDHDGVSNHQPHGCLFNRSFGRRSKKTSKLRVTGLCAGKSPGPVNSPHKGPVTRKMFPFDDVIMKKQRSPSVTILAPFSGSKSERSSTKNIWFAQRHIPKALVHL